MDPVGWPNPVKPWSCAFALAWEAFHAGSVPVGAVVVGPSGDVVTSGRSRAFETEAPRGQVCGTYLAHAEMNALLQLPAGDYWDHVVYTTLEPCLLCTAALTHTHIGLVRYAARDRLWAGIERLPELNPHVRRRWCTREHAVSGPLELWASLLVLVFQLERRPGTEAAAEAPPALLHLARHLTASRELHRLVGTTVSEAIAAFRDRLDDLDSPS